MKRRVWWMGLIGVGVALVGVWGTWVPHRAAALVLSGWDLTEYVKFLPDVSPSRELFYLPVWCGGMALSLLGFRSTTALGARIGLIGVALGLMVAILPPYPHILDGFQSSEYRWQFVLGVSGTAAVLLGRLSSPWSAHRLGGLLTILALLGAVPALWQFLNVRSAMEAIYGTPLGWGWGLASFLAGWGLLAAVGGWLLFGQGNGRQKHAAFMDLKSDR